jgi:flagellar basal-body rod modification protein FlgD
MATDINSLATSNSYGTATTTASGNVGEDKSILGKDDFLKLLLVELQNQDPTNPQDSDKILQQTSELASLEASTNTNKALENLSTSMSNSSQFSAISTIGKMADMGTDSVILDGGTPIEFGIYFPDALQTGEIKIKNNQGITVDTISISNLEKGTNNFEWDGRDKSGNAFEDGYYSVEASYSTYSGEIKEAKFGLYPVEAVRFNGGEAEVRLGTSYVPLSSVKEIYNPS